MRTAFVGQREVKPAGEYHDSDFVWEEHAAVAAPLLESKLEKNDDDGDDDGGDGDGGDGGGDDKEQGRKGSPRSSSSSSSSPSSSPPPAPEGDYLSAWESFHGKDNSSSRFYKERRYLPLAFPALRDEERTRHVLELGCGCGSALLPVLRSNSSCVVTGTDVSPRAVAAFVEAARSSGLAEFEEDDDEEEGQEKESIEKGREPRSRIAGAFALDATAVDAGDVLTRRLLTDCSPPVDAVLIVFTLGALKREDQVAALRVAAAALRAGRGEGREKPSSHSSSFSPRVYVRDHGLFDVTHMRAPRRVEKNLHSRSDGTLCYFFSPEDLEATAREAGLRPVCCKWATVERANKKTGQVLRRVFVHGEFELVE